MYDSTEDTLKHIETVRGFVLDAVRNLINRAVDHDQSKLLEPEKSMYDEFTPKLRELAYGSDEYRECLKQMGVALKHHYENNSHHPEHYLGGINDMSLFDVVEMLADWKAAGMRHADGDMSKSLEINRGRFGISDQLFRIIRNTVEEMDW